MSRVYVGLKFGELMNTEEVKSKGEMLMEMFKLQLEEDRKVQQEFSITYEDLLDGGSYFCALLDELGELNHEEKPEWCWWKKNAGKVDRDKVLEEFADVTHFVLSYCLAINSTIKSGTVLSQCLVYGIAPDQNLWSDLHSESLQTVTSGLLNNIAWFDLVNKDQTCIEHNIGSVLTYWHRMITLSGYDFKKDVYEPYIKKNAINQQRVEDGY